MEAASPEDAATGAASLQQLPAGAAQQMAACLATPFTGTDKNMGEILRSEVDRLNANQELQTQLRCAVPPRSLLTHFQGSKHVYN